MTRDNDVPDTSEGLDADITEDSSDDVIELLADDDAGDSTEEINVDALVAKIDATDAKNPRTNAKFVSNSKRLTNNVTTNSAAPITSILTTTYRQALIATASESLATAN